MTAQISIAFQTDKTIKAYGPLAAQVEAFGFDGVSVYNDMLYQPAWLPLLEMARQTKRIRLGPAAVNPFTCHPIHIAGNLALIDEMSRQQRNDGRVYLGMARGAWLDFVGLAVPKPITAVAEALACIRHLLTRSLEPFPGQIFPLAGGDTLRWSPIDANLPFMLGSWGPKMIQACLPFVAEVKLGGSANPGAVRWLSTLLPDVVGKVIGSVTVVDEDGRVAREKARREVALYLPVVADLDPNLQLEPERLAGIRAAMAQYDVDTAVTYISDDLLHRFAFAGSPSEIVTQTLALFQAGATRVEWGTPHGLTTASGLNLLGRMVLPQTRQALR